MKNIHSFMIKRRDDMTRSFIRIPIIMLALLLLSVGMVQAQSGSIEPPASAFDGSGNPQATTQTQPSWDQALGLSRFKFVMGGAEAVLDRETELVWERTPRHTTTHNWSSALIECVSRTVGGRKGWRLPSVHELASLVDLDNSNPSLPLIHPFINVQSAHYWSATTNANNTTRAWNVFFNDGGVSNNGKTFNCFVWCVRGGQNHGDAY